MARAPWKSEADQERARKADERTAKIRRQLLREWRGEGPPSTTKLLALYDVLFEAVRMRGAAKRVSLPRCAVEAALALTRRAINRKEHAAYLRDLRTIDVADFVRVLREAGATRADAIAVAADRFKETEATVRKMVERAAPALRANPLAYRSAYLVPASERAPGETREEMVAAARRDLERMRQVLSARRVEQQKQRRAAASIWKLARRPR